MQDHNLLTGHQWRPLTEYGLTNSFWTFHTETLLSTGIVTILLIMIAIHGHYALKKDDSITRFIILKYVQSFKNLLIQTLQSCPIEHLGFIGSLFTFIFCCNVISIIPFLIEPTKDLNTTLALSLISFFYVQGNAIYHKGIGGYLKDFTHPFILMFPLHVIGKLTSIMSLSFRLFGNIFGGYVITHLWFQLVSSSLVLQCIGLLTGTNILLQTVFCVFDGGIQAFVFSMLTLTYLSMEIAPEETAQS